MALLVPYSYVSFCPDNPERGRWDQAWVDRIVRRAEWRVPGGIELVEGDISNGGVVIVPLGHHAEHGCKGREQLETLVRAMPWSLIIATSDEGSTFPWDAWLHSWDRHRVWIMTPQPHKKYPWHAFFIGEGSPYSAEEVASHALPNWRKTTDVSFRGQINHERRVQMRDAFLTLPGSVDAAFNETEGFAQGLEPGGYLGELTRSKAVACPSGPLTQDSFRFYESLEAQAVPLADTRRPGAPPGDYWGMLFKDFDLALSSWRDLRKNVQKAVQPQRAPQVSAWWQRYKRSVAYRLNDDLLAVMPTKPQPDLTASDKVTALVVTSPSPLHPATDMIEETIQSIRERLPHAEILVGIDGLRPEQQHYQGPYQEYSRRLTALVNPLVNVLPVVFTGHRHQSGMMTDMLQMVTTPFALFVEHDTPLCGDIDFDACLDMMDRHELAMLRFSHEARVLEEHEHLFLETKPGKDPFVRTVQYSARPHLIRTDKFRDIVSTYFGSEATTFLEDTLYGALQHLPKDILEDLSTERLQTEEQWRRHRMAVYAPEGSWVRSRHTDGRRGDPKWKTWIAYDGDRPDGGPPPGWMHV